MRRCDKELNSLIGRSSESTWTTPGPIGTHVEPPRSRGQSHLAGFAQALRRGRGLQAEHAGNEPQAVLDPVIDFVDQYFLLLQLAEFASRTAVNLEHAPVSAVGRLRLENGAQELSHRFLIMRPWPS
jgi:hypothetical protein